MGQQMMSDGAKRNNLGAHSKLINSNALMNRMRWLHVTALVTRLMREGLCEEGIVQALTTFYPEYASLIQDNIRTPYDPPMWITISPHTYNKAAAMHKVDVVRSADGQWACHYEYPRDAEAVHSDDSPFLVQVAEDMTFESSTDRDYIRCMEQTGTALLKITGKCASVMTARGAVEIFGRSLSDETGFFLAAIREGEAICVTTHDGSQSRVYLFMDDVVNELDVAQWHNNFEPFLLPLD